MREYWYYHYINDYIMHLNNVFTNAVTHSTIFENNNNTWKKIRDPRCAGPHITSSRLFRVRQRIHNQPVLRFLYMTSKMGNFLNLNSLSLNNHGKILNFEMFPGFSISAYTLLR